MKEVEISRWRIVVQGFTNVKIKDPETLLDQVRKEAKGCEVQFFDASLLAGFDHLYFAFLNASRAFETGRNISKNLSVEALLCASGQHQISRAIEILGVKPNSARIAVTVAAHSLEKAIGTLNRISDFLQGKRSDEVIELTEEKVKVIKAAFGITDLEIEATLRESEKDAVTGLLIERGALLATHG